MDSTDIVYKQLNTMGKHTHTNYKHNYYRMTHDTERHKQRQRNIYNGLTHINIKRCPKDCYSLEAV